MQTVKISNERGNKMASWMVNRCEYKEKHPAIDAAWYDVEVYQRIHEFKKETVTI